MSDNATAVLVLLILCALIAALSVTKTWRYIADLEIQAERERAKADQETA